MADSFFLWRLKPKALSKSHFVILLILLVGTFSLRISGISWSLPPYDIKEYHPDEYKIIRGAYKFPQDILDRKDLRYPTGLHYTIGLVTWPVREAIEASGNESFSYTFVHIAGRGISILLGTGTVLLVYHLAKQHFDETHAIISASIISVSMYHVLNSTWATTDVATSFFLTLFFLLLKPTAEKRTLRLAILTGAVLGMLIGIKYTGSIAIIGFVIYFYIQNGSKEDKFIPRVFRSLLSDWRIWVIVISALVVFLITTPGIWLKFNSFIKAFEWEQSRLAQSDLPIYNPLVWKNMFDSLITSIGLPLAILSCIGILINLFRPGAFATAATALVILYLGFFGDALVPRYFIMISPILAIFSARALLFYYPWTKPSHRIVNIIVISLVVLQAFLYTLSGAISRYPDSRTITSQYITKEIPAGSEIGIAYTSPEYDWDYHKWRYPYVDYDRFEQVDFLEFPDYLVVSSYDSNQIKDTLQSGILFEGYEFPSVYDNQWYRNSPPSPEIFAFYDQLYFAEDSPYELVYEVSPYNPDSPIEFPSPTIEIFKLID